MMLADATPSWTETVLVLSMFAGGVSVLMNVAMAYFMKQQTDFMRRQANNPQPTTIGPQPLAVEVVEEFEDRFASKVAFEQHAAGNTARHSQLFSRIEQVERAARTELKSEIDAIQEDRKASWEKLNTEFTFIRESISAINTELKIRANCGDCSNFKSR